MAKEIIQELNGILADLTVFYQKLRHYHWNIKGPQFFQLHEKYELVYTELGDTIDALAERIVGLDGVPLHTLAQMLEATSLEEDAELPAGSVMVSRTIADIDVLTEKLAGAIEAAEKAEDRTTTNLLDETKDSLEAHLWMYKAWQQ